MFHPDFNLEAPSGTALLAEIGVDPVTVREVIEDDRAIRCPDRDSVYRDRPRAMFGIDTPIERALRQAATTTIAGQSPALPPTE